MKKLSRFLCFLCVISLLCVFISAADAVHHGYLITKLQKNTDQVCVEVYSKNSSSSDSLWVALYAEDGRILQIKCFSLASPPPKKGEPGYSETLPENAYHATKNPYQTFEFACTGETYYRIDAFVTSNDLTPLSFPCTVFADGSYRITPTTWEAYGSFSSSERSSFIKQFSSTKEFSAWSKIAQDAGAISPTEIGAGTEIVIG